MSITIIDKGSCFKRKSLTLKYQKNGRVKVKKIFATIRSKMVMNTFGRELLHIINKLYLEDIVFFICDLFEPCFDKDDIKEAKKLFTDRRREVISMIKNLADEESKVTYRELLKYRMSGKRKLLFKVGRPSKEQYFMNVSDRNILPLKGEYFVDCGAYTGDTLLGYLKSKGTIEKYYAFEPNKYNCEVIADRVRKLACSDKVEIYPFAVSDKCGIMYFDVKTGVSGASKLAESGKEHVKVTTLDDTLRDKKVTFIKMDIEGAELSALRGGKKTILEQKPTLAISIYHSNADMIDIYNYIHELVPEYKFYVRHYGIYFNETILYAIMD